MIPLLLALGGTLPQAHAADFPTQGTWAMQLRIASAADIPILGTSISWTDTLLRVTLTPTSSGWVLAQEPCAVDIHDGFPMVHTVLPPAFVAALPSRTAAVAYDSHTGAFQVDLGMETVGLERGAEVGPMPTDPDDPRVTDWDQDGQPGATVVVRTPLFGDTEVYVVQRATSSLSGTVLSDAEITGQVRVDALEQSVVGAERRLFHTQPRIRPDAEHSAFHLIKVDDGATCAALVPAWAELFDRGALAQADSI